MLSKASQTNSNIEMNDPGMETCLHNCQAYAAMDARRTPRAWQQHWFDSFADKGMHCAHTAPYAALP